MTECNAMQKALVDIDQARLVGLVEAALAALLTTTMPAVQETIDAVVAAGLRDQVKIMVGGAVFVGDTRTGYVTAPLYSTVMNTTAGKWRR